MENIKEIINDPEKLERVYRQDKKSFESDFEKIYPEIENTAAARFWSARLNFDKTPDVEKARSLAEIFILIGVCLFSGFLIKIPDLFNVDLTRFLFYQKNAGIIFFLGLTMYTITNKVLSRKELISVIIVFFVSIIYLNFLPNLKNSSSINLAYIFMPLFIWVIYGIVFIEFDFKDLNKRIDFIKHNGDMAIMGSIILLAGGALTGVTISLFKAIGINVQYIYMNYIVMVGLVSAPVVDAYILKNFPLLTTRIAPVIANFFSPLVLLTLVVYLVVFTISGKDPFTNRDFLMIFNIMLIGVMGIIVFSVSETSLIAKQRFHEIVLLILSLVTLIINLIALSAIFYRLSEYGLTPNRLAVLVSNILIFCNLILIAIDLFKINFNNSVLGKVEQTIAKFLPVYLIWTIIVVFGFPVIFGMS